MEKHRINQIIDDLKTYCHLAKDDDYIAVTEWKSGEGFDIDLNGRLIRLTNGELEAIKHLANCLIYKSDENDKK